ncbi:MAG: hypothetical protein C0592_02765 [Marinilabiliales bacterium]|nr:MAG: hypothetical protein C0592_02765 [Marinilabiliales bacterium]
MYKVFLRNKELIFTDCAGISGITGKVIQDPELSEIQNLITELDRVKEYDRYILCTADAEKLFIHFYMSMKIVTAAGGLVRNDANDLLLIFRRNHWDLPKGKIDSGETEEQTAIREVEEETGVRGLSIISRLPATFHVYTIGKEWILKETHWFSMMCSKPDNYKPQAEEGITEIRWIPENEIEDMIPQLYPSLRQLVIDTLD